MVVHRHDPVSDWLVWRYLALIGGALLWALSCLAGGFAIARRIGATALPMRECLVQAFMLGVLAFALATVLVGLPGGLGAASFFAMPLAFLAVGGWPLVKYLRKGVRRVRKLKPRPPSMVVLAGTLVAAACCAGLYLNILSPSNLAYDARWYHLPIAEQYAATGFVFRFDEGWFSGLMPHLASWLYTWAFCLPGGSLFARIELAAHLEYVLFAATLFAMPVLIDRLIARPRIRAGWAGFFLFPGILVYDSGLSGAADHVLAFWAIPIFVALRQFWRRPTARDGLLLGAALAGAALTKYQSIYLLVFPIGAVGLRALWQARSRPSFKAALVPNIVLAATFLVATSPHWLLNLVWHGHPLYPMYPGYPLAEGIASGFEGSRLKDYYPNGTLPQRLFETLKGVLTFGFVSYDWQTFHGTRPVFGSLFIPSVALIPFVRARRRLLPLALAAIVGVAAWYWTHHFDRYLQALTPWMAACVVPVMAGLWRQSKVSRPWLGLLVVMQLLSCADLYFLPTHAMSGRAPIQATIDLITTAHRKAFAERNRTDTGAGPPTGAISGLVPATAKVLVHEVHVHLGLGVAAVRDGWGMQGAINYSTLKSPTEVARHLKSLGVTHALWSSPIYLMRFQDDVSFFRFTQVMLQPQQVAGGWWLGALPETIPETKPLRIAMVACRTEALDLPTLNVRWLEFWGAACDKPDAPDYATLLPDADVVALDSRKYPVVPTEISSQFSLLFTRDSFNVLGRR